MKKRKKDFVDILNRKLIQKLVFQLLTCFFCFLLPLELVKRISYIIAIHLAIIFILFCASAICEVRYLKFFKKEKNILCKNCKHFLKDSKICSKIDTVTHQRYFNHVDEDSWCENFFTHSNSKFKERG